MFGDYWENTFGSFMLFNFALLCLPVFLFRDALFPRHYAFSCKETAQSFLQHATGLDGLFPHVTVFNHIEGGARHVMETVCATLQFTWICWDHGNHAQPVNCCKLENKKFKKV